jgi:hypothetical protein
MAALVCLGYEWWLGVNTPLDTLSFLALQLTMVHMLAAPTYEKLHMIFSVLAAVLGLYLYRDPSLRSFEGLYGLAVNLMGLPHLAVVALSFSHAHLLPQRTKAFDIFLLVAFSYVEKLSWAIHLALTIGGLVAVAVTLQRGRRENRDAWAGFLSQLKKDLLRTGQGETSVAPLVLLYFVYDAWGFGPVVALDSLSFVGVVTSLGYALAWPEPVNMAVWATGLVFLLGLHLYWTPSLRSLEALQPLALNLVDLPHLTTMALSFCAAKWLALQAMYVDVVTVAAFYCIRRLPTALQLVLLAVSVGSGIACRGRSNEPAGEAGAKKME